MTRSIHAIEPPVHPSQSSLSYVEPFFSFSLQDAARAAVLKLPRRAQAIPPTRACSFATLRPSWVNPTDTESEDPQLLGLPCRLLQTTQRAPPVFRIHHLHKCAISTFHPLPVLSPDPTPLLPTAAAAPSIKLSPTAAPAPATAPAPSASSGGPVTLSWAGSGLYFFWQLGEAAMRPCAGRGQGCRGAGLEGQACSGIQGSKREGGFLWGCYDCQ